MSFLSSTSKFEHIHTIDELESETNKTMHKFIDDAIKSEAPCLTKWNKHENTEQYNKIKSKLINDDSVAKNRYPHCWIVPVDSINDIEQKYRISFEFAFKIVIQHNSELYVSTFICSYHQLEAIHHAAIDSQLFPTAVYPRVHPNVIKRHRTEELNNDIKLENLYTTLEDKLMFTGPRKHLFSRKPLQAQQKHLEYFCIVLNKLFNCAAFAIQNVVYDILNTYDSKQKQYKTVNIHPDLALLLKHKALSKLKQWRHYLKCQLRLYSTEIVCNDKVIIKCEFKRHDPQTKKYSIVVNRNELKELFCSSYHSAFVVSRKESLFADHWAIILEGEFYLLLVEYYYDHTQKKQNGVVSYQIFKNDNNGQRACWYSAKKTNLNKQLFNERWSTLSKSYLMKTQFGKYVNFKFINELVEKIWMKETQFVITSHNCQHFVRNLYAVLDPEQAKFLNLKLGHKQVANLLPSGPVADHFAQIMDMGRFIETAQKEVKFMECKDNDNYAAILNVFVDDVDHKENVKEIHDEKYDNYEQEQIKANENVMITEEIKLDDEIQIAHQASPISIESTGQMFSFVKSTFHFSDPEFVNPNETNSTRARLCTIVEIDEDKYDSPTVVSSVNQKHSKHVNKQCTQCQSLETLIFQLMKEVEFWKQQTNTLKCQINESNILQNNLKTDVSLLVQQQHSNNHIIDGNKPMLSNDQNGYNSESSSSTINLQQSSTIANAKNIKNKQKAKKTKKKKKRRKSSYKSVPRLLTNQYTRKFGNYATYSAVNSENRAQGRIQIAKEFTTEIIPALIREDISNVFSYIDTYTALQNGYEYNNGKLRIFNYDFHNKIDGNQTYCVAKRQDENKETNRGYKWRMEISLFTKNEIEAIYNVSGKMLPKTEQFMTYQINSQHMNELNEIVAKQMFICDTNWYKVPVYSRNPKRRICRRKLSLTADEFTKRVIPKKHKQLFPILMFRNAKPLIQYICIAEIVLIDYISLFQSKDLLSKDCSIAIISIILEYTSGSKEFVSITDIGIAFEYNKQLKCCQPVGIHLDKNSMFSNYQILFPRNSMDELDDFDSKYDDLQIGNVDENENVIKRMKYRIEQMNKELEQIEQPLSLQ